MTRNVAAGLALLISASASAQSYRNSAVLGEPKLEGFQPQAVGPHNYWYGAQMALVFPTTSQVASSFSGSAGGGYLFTPSGIAKQGGALGFTNLSALAPNANSDEVSQKVQAILQSSEGFSAGIQVYYLALDSQYVRITPWFTAAYKLNAAKALNSTDTVYLHQARGWLGADFDLGALSEGKSPFTVTLDITYIGASKTKFESVLGADQFHPWAAEGTLVIPIAGGVGVLLEGNLPIGGVSDAGGRVGIVFAGSHKL